MSQFLQIFTCGKCDLLPLRKPFYRGRVASRRIPSQVVAESRSFRCLHDPGKPRIVSIFDGIGRKTTASPRISRCVAEKREGFTLSSSRFFQGARDIVLSSANKEENLIALERNK